jgi:hypothetical protein
MRDAVCDHEWRPYFAHLVCVKCGAGQRGGVGTTGLEDGGTTAYERPTVTPIGNLHDLVNGASGTVCDAATGEFDNIEPQC